MRGMWAAMAEHPNKAALTDALDIYLDEMRPFVHRCVRRVPGLQAGEAIAEALNYPAREKFRARIERGESVEGAIDASDIPHVVGRWWRDVFSQEFADDRGAQNLMWVIRDARNRAAHRGEHDLAAPYARARVHDIADVMRRIGRDEAARRVDAILDAIGAGSAEASPPATRGRRDGQPGPRDPASLPAGPPADRTRAAAGGGGMTGDTAVKTFRDDEDGYHAWLRTHRGGWVINKGAPSYGLKLHRATCDTISKPGVAYTSREFVKICSTDRTALVAWARRTAEPSTGCPVCNP